MFLYTTNERSEREIQEAIPFTTASKRMKNLGINLPKEAKDLYSRNYKMLVKGIKEDITRWKDIPRPWIERISSVKMRTLLKAVYKFNTIPNKLLMAFFTVVE